MTDSHLLEIARTARDSAYAPYSSFAVGAAILTSEGSVFCGSNIENISFGLTMCAERVAVGSAVQKGHRAFMLLAIISDSGVPVVPCGACRQVLAEFNPALRIISANLAGATAEFWLENLLPSAKQGILR